MTYNTQSARDRGTVYHYRNLLNLRNVKGKVKNSYRPYKMMYYTVLDAIIVVMFLKHFDIKVMDDELTLPENYSDMPDSQKILWLNDVCRSILQKWFFDDSDDICEKLRAVLENPDHSENYWVSNIEHGRMKCHFCDKSYAFVGTLKAHEQNKHKADHKQSTKKKDKTDSKDELHDYILMLFKLTMLHRNLDTAVDMGDGERSVRSAKYELPIYKRTNKVKYSIGSIHLTSLTNGVLSEDQTERLIANSL